MFFFHLFLLSTAFSFQLDERNLNLFLAYYMAGFIFLFSPILFRNAWQNKSMVVLILSILISANLNPSFFKGTSLILSLANLLFYAQNSFYINNLIDSDQKIRFIKGMLLLFLLTLLLQQWQYYRFGYFFNHISSDVGAFNILSSEPSYAATTVFLLYYVLISNNLHNKNSISIHWIWLVITLYLLVYSGSVYGLIFSIILLLKKLWQFSPMIRYLALFLVFPFIILFFQYFFQFTPGFKRIMLFSSALLWDSGDIFQNLSEADHSGAVRLLPFISMFKDFKYYSFFGHGVGFTGTLMPNFISGLNEDFGGGVLPGFIYDLGMVSFVFLVIFIWKCVKPSFFDVIIMLLISFNTSFNVQLFWFTLTMLTLKNRLKNNPKILDHIVDFSNSKTP